jgi:pyruvate ferredoxin oxidoreductase alpha subunit
MDGFNTSHSVENLEILETPDIKKFVGEYVPENSFLDIDNPVTYGPVALQNSYFEFRIDQEKAMMDALNEYTKIARDYEKISGRRYDVLEKYKTEDADKILILAGSSAGTSKEVIDKLRNNGEKVGLLEINLFRPYPRKEMVEALKNSKEIIVLDRAQSIGTNPPFYSEIINSLYGVADIKISSFIYGLGGRDIFQKQIEDVLKGKIKDKYIK